MLRFNILKWADEKISSLKEKDIIFINNVPQLPSEFIYEGIPCAITTFAYRNDISLDDRNEALLSFFMYEDRLWPRLNKIDEDIEILRNYGGATGFDLSPSIGMLRPRQRLSILINAIHSCYLGINGIKILPNYRAGDFGTICTADYFPDDCSFIVGNLGCSKNGFKNYGEYQLDIVLTKKNPSILYIYGSISNKEACRLIKKNQFEIISFSDRRNRVRNCGRNYHYYYHDGKIEKNLFCEISRGGDF